MAYQVTIVGDTNAGITVKWHMQSITAMEEYRNRSFEELRLQAYETTLPPQYAASIPRVHTLQQYPHPYPGPAPTSQFNIPPRTTLFPDTHPSFHDHLADWRKSVTTQNTPIHPFLPSNSAPPLGVLPRNQVKNPFLGPGKDSLQTFYPS